MISYVPSNILTLLLSVHESSRTHAAPHKKCAYFVFDLKTGADLRHYLRKKLLFEEVNVGFYIACIGSGMRGVVVYKMLLTQKCRFDDFPVRSSKLTHLDTTHISTFPFSVQ